MDGDLPSVSFELAFQCHRFEVNQHPVAEVMPVLLRSGQSASREEAVEKRNVCRSLQNSWHRSIWTPERGPSIFQDRLKPRSHTKLPKYPWTTRNPIYVFLSHCWRLRFLDTFLYSIILVLELERKSILLQRLIGTPLILLLLFILLYYSDYDLCFFYHVWVIHLVRLRDFMSLLSNW